MTRTKTSFLNALSSSKPMRLFAFLLLLLFPSINYAQESITLKVLPGLAQTYQDKGFISDWYQPKPALNFATDLEFRLSENLNLLTGLRFYNRGENHYFFSSSREDRKNREPLTSRYFYMSIPVGVVVNSGNFYGGLGYEANMLLNKVLDISSYRGWTSSGITKSYDYLNGAFALAGYQMNVSENLILSPEIYYSMTLKERFINAGAGIGLRYAL